MHKGDMVIKRWGKIEPEEKDTIGLVINVSPGMNWDFVEVAYPFGVRYFRMTELNNLTTNKGGHYDQA